MKMKDSVTNKQLYEAIMEVHKKIDEIVNNRVVPLEKWQSRIIGQIGAITFIFGIGINLIIEWIREKIN